MSSFSVALRKSVPGLLFTVLAGLLLCTWAIYNGYPLVYPDTGTYISSAFRHYIPIDRSVMYSMFLRRMSFDRSLWLTVAAQALLMAWSIRLLVQRFAPAGKEKLFYLLLVAGLTFTTGIAVNTGQLIADLFTPITVMTFLLLLYSSQEKRGRRFLYFILFSIAAPMHFSHFPLMLLLLGFAFLAWWFRLRKKADPVFGGKAILRCTAAVLASALVLISVNFTVNGKFSFSPQGSHVFTMQRFIHCGILPEYLEKNCPGAPAELCAARDHLDKIDFLWDSRNSPVYANGSNWMDHKAEYDKIISDIFHEPVYIRRFAWCSLRDTWKQLGRFHTGTVPPLGIGSAPYGEIFWHYKKEAPLYITARQQKEQLHFDLLNTVQLIVVSLSALLLLSVLVLPVLRRCISPLQQNLVLLVFAAYLLNAFVCVTFAVIDDRFSARLAWLFPLLLALLAADQNVRDKFRLLFQRRK